MDKKYKYTLLKETGTPVREQKKSEIGVCKLFGFFLLTVFVIFFYACTFLVDVNSPSITERNLMQFSDNAFPTVADEIWNSTAKLEHSTSAATLQELLVQTTNRSEIVRDINQTTSTQTFFSSSTTISTISNTLMTGLSYQDNTSVSSSQKLQLDRFLNEILKTTTILPTTKVTTTTKTIPATTSTTLPNETTNTPKIILKRPTPPLIIIKSLNSEKFFVKTEQCHMPWVNPFTKEIKKKFKPGKYKDCSNDSPLISSVFNETQQRYILNVNNTKIEDLSCCYQQIVRTGSGKNADKKFDILPCVNFHQDFVVPQHIDFMIVDCKSKSQPNTTQKDAFSFIQARNKTPGSDNLNNSTRRPTVLLIGIDSLSRFNFRRNMPKTAKFLAENNWIEMEGYNKVGDNTFPNLMPVLAGLNESISYSKCKPKFVGGLDNCTFLWNHYNAHGYATAYAEDAAWMSTFNYLKNGFEKQPTDYYLRPFMIAVEKKMKTTKKAGMTFCIGRRHAAEYIYDFGLEFGKRHRHKPGFGLFWTNSFSHNSYDVPSTMDVKMVEYFERMKSEGVLETSIVVFFSDHGCRWGPLLDLPEGFLEERLPMFFISLPKWFYETYPNYANALKINRNRLTTPFDAHQTLMHILDLDKTSKSALEPAFSCEGAQSLFHEVSENRTCEDACIPEHWCTCDPYEVLSNYNPHVKKVTDLIIDEINNYLKAINLSSLCSTLKRNSISRAEIKSENEGGLSRTETFRIKFDVQPKKARFQATAVYDLVKQKVQVVIEDISRLDSYAPHSKCIDNKVAKKFCICNH